MSDLARIAALVFAAWLALSGLCACKDGAGRTQAPQPRKQSAKPAAAKPPWPHLSGEREAGELAQNLIAKNFVVIFDGSGSMSETQCAEGRTKIKVAKKAVIEWSESVPAGAQVGLVSFHKQGWSSMPVAPYDRDAFLDVINSIEAGGSTPLAQAVQRANEMLTSQAKKQLGYGEYTIVVVTDGIADDPKKLMGTVNPILEQTPMVIHTIGFCIGDQHSLNQPGRTYYRTANNPAALRKGLQEVLAEAESFDVTDFR